MRKPGNIGRLFVAICAFLAIDNCFLGDPTVDLGNGYEIVAVSAGSPCFLNYRPWADKREYSGWHAIASTTVHSRNGEERTPYLLTHEEQEWVEFDNEDEWRREWKERKATFGPEEIGRVDGITAFRSEGNYVVGAFNNGFLLLDMARNQVDTFRDRDQWQRAVESVSNISVGRLKNPKSWFEQSRNVGVLTLTAGILALWCIWPQIRQIHRRYHP